MISCRKDTQKNKIRHAVEAFIIELEKLCSSCFLVGNMQKRLESLGMSASM